MFVSTSVFTLFTSKICGSDILEYLKRQELFRVNSSSRVSKSVVSVGSVSLSHARVEVVPLGVPVPWGAP